MYVFSVLLLNFDFIFCYIFNNGLNEFIVIIVLYVIFFDDLVIILKIDKNNKRFKS